MLLKQIRIHGRGGQGAVTLGELIALSAYYSGKKVQAFPSFGVERRGAPAESYIRISDKEITRRDHIRNPDYLVVLDSTLLGASDVVNGLDKGDIVFVNSAKGGDNLGKYLSIYPDIKIMAFDAAALAVEVLGRPIVNTAMLGAFAYGTKLFTMKDVARAIKEKLAEKGSETVMKNIELAQKAYDHFGDKEIKN
ncbi:MAG: 2-oxoacid:acceptor oxidoreductase family protein [Patescibacteria group bacterium]|nr:2-oxoacid:acceptor oxidoreductase family protein [Patescibacteria group bacterium]